MSLANSEPRQFGSRECLSLCSPAQGESSQNRQIDNEHSINTNAHHHPPKTARPSPPPTPPPTSQCKPPPPSPPRSTPPPQPPTRPPPSSRPLTTFEPPSPSLTGLACRVRAPLGAPTLVAGGRIRGGGAWRFDLFAPGLGLWVLVSGRGKPLFCVLIYGGSWCWYPAGSRRRGCRVGRGSWFRKGGVRPPRRGRHRFGPNWLGAVRRRQLPGWHRGVVKTAGQGLRVSCRCRWEHPRGVPRLAFRGQGTGCYGGGLPGDGSWGLSGGGGILSRAESGWPDSRAIDTSLRDNTRPRLRPIQATCSGKAQRTMSLCDGRTACVSSVGQNVSEVGVPWQVGVDFQ